MFLLVYSSLMEGNYDHKKEYVLGLTRLLHKLQTIKPNDKHFAFANDLRRSEKTRENKIWLGALITVGPEYGYYQ